MTGHSMGTLFCLTTYGESHGESIGAVVSGCPAGLALSEVDLQTDCDRRRPGASRYTSGRREQDQVRIISGVYQGLTTGAPIALSMANTDARSKDYDALQGVLRPGHADYSHWKKYGHRDPRGGGRASARETAMRVAAGGIAKKYLALHAGTKIWAYVAQIGAIKAKQLCRDAIEQNPFFFADPSKLAALEALLVQLRRDGDAVGARVNVVAEGVPAGLGEPMYGRLDADIAKAMMGIQAAKGVEIGDGFQVVSQLSSKHRDDIHPDGFGSNHAGGILGGVATGQPITAGVAFKPTSSIRLPIKSIDHDGQPCEVVSKGRHDPCVGIRAVPVVEAMMALVLMDHLLCQRARHPEALQAALAAGFSTPA